MEVMYGSPYRYFFNTDQQFLDSVNLRLQKLRNAVNNTLRLPHKDATLKSLLKFSVRLSLLTERTAYTSAAFGIFGKSETHLALTHTCCTGPTESSIG